MKKLLSLILVAAAIAVFSACNSDDGNSLNLDDYQDWRKENEAWVTELMNRKNADGSAYYTTVVPVWDPGAYVLMHQFNNPAETADNLTPLYTSTVDVRYIGRNCKGEPFDSSYTQTAYGPGIGRFTLSGVISGWTIAMERMHVGDSVEIIIPWQSGYGTNYNSAILPYSALQFNVRLVDIYKYEAPNN